MLKHKGILALVAVAVLTLGAGTAAAANSYSTSIHLRSTSGSQGNKDDILNGDIHTNGKCLADRTMKMYKKVGSEFRLVDVDRTSADGAWTLRGNLSGLPDLQIRATEETRRHGHVICKGHTNYLTASTTR